MAGVMPLVPLTLVVLLWAVSHAYVAEVAIHGPGPGYVYFESGVGKICMGRCIDVEDQWRGVRRTFLPVHQHPHIWLWTSGSTFDMFYGEYPGFEEFRVWFPHWLMCLAAGVWPAHSAFAFLRRRLMPPPQTAWSC